SSSRGWRRRSSRPWTAASGRSSSCPAGSTARSCWPRCAACGGCRPGHRATRCASAWAATSRPPPGRRSSGPTRRRGRAGSPRYQTTVVETAEGKVYQGLVVYEAVDSLILMTGPATTVRFTGRQVADRRLSPTSLMPAGLLDRLADAELADLYAYLRSLGSAV